MRSTKIAGTLVLSLSLLGGCQTNEQTGALTGAGIGALAGAALGGVFGGGKGAAIGALAGGALGAGAGTLIGQQLDQRDRERAEAARRQALMSQTPRAVAWSSDHNQGVRGTVAVTNIQRQAGGGECRMVRETAYVRGEEVIENIRYCQNASGQWAPRA